MYPSIKISTTVLNDLLNNQVISTECLCWDYHLGLYVVEKIWPTALYCFLLVGFYDWIQTSELGGENQGVFNYGAIWGFAVRWWWFLCSFFKKNCGGEETGCFWLTDCEDEDQTSSHFNINAIGDFRCLLFELTQSVLVSVGKKFKDGKENTKLKVQTVTKWKLHDHKSCYMYRDRKDTDLDGQPTLVFQN